MSTTSELDPVSELKKLIVENNFENDLLNQLFSLKFKSKALKSASETDKNNLLNKTVSLNSKSINQSDDLKNFKSKTFEKLEILKSSKLKIRIDDNFLKRFITTEKSDPKKAFKRYKSYYKTVLLLPNIIDIIEHDYSWFSESTDYLFGKELYLNGTNLAAGIYGHDKFGRVILGFQCKLFDLNSPNFDKYCWYGLLVLFEYVSTKYETFQSKGFVFVANFKGFSYKMMTNLATTNNLKIVSKFLNGSIPASAKNVFFCGEPVLFNLVNKMLKPFLAKKMSDRICMVGKNFNKITEALGGDEYTPNFISGGKLEPIDIPGKNIVHGVELIEQSVPQLM